MLTQLEDPYFFHYVFLGMLKFLFVKLEWLKILKERSEEDYPIAATEISHILFTDSDFIFLLY